MEKKSCCVTARVLALFRSTSNVPLVFRTCSLFPQLPHLRPHSEHGGSTGTISQMFSPFLEPELGFAQGMERSTHFPSICMGKFPRAPPGCSLVLAWTREQLGGKQNSLIKKGIHIAKLPRNETPESPVRVPHARHGVKSGSRATLLVGQPQCRPPSVRSVATLVREIRGPQQLWIAHLHPLLHSRHRVLPSHMLVLQLT